MITDRTLQDVEYAKAHQNSSEDLKGAYNNSDLNRVEAKVQELKEILKSYNYFDEELVIKLDWAKTDFLRTGDSERYLGNVRKIRDAYFTKTTTPDLPITLNKMDYQDANAIEQILVDIEDIIINMEQMFVYCGVANMGQPRLWQQRFRRKYVVVSGYTQFIEANGEIFETSDGEEYHVKE